MSYDFRKLQKILTRNGFRWDEPHWDVAVESRRLRTVHDIFECLGDPRLDDKRFRLKKSPNCSHKLCVHPNCYYFASAKSLGNGSAFLDYEDFIGACDDFDLDEFERMGLQCYLERYNETLPDFLKLNEAQIKEVYAYVKKNIDK